MFIIGACLATLICPTMTKGACGEYSLALSSEKYSGNVCYPQTYHKFNMIQADTLLVNLHYKVSDNRVQIVPHT